MVFSSLCATALCPLGTSIELGAAASVHGSWVPHGVEQQREAGMIYASITPRGTGRGGQTGSWSCGACKKAIQVAAHAVYIGHLSAICVYLLDADKRKYVYKMLLQDLCSYAVNISRCV